MNYQENRREKILVVQLARLGDFLQSTLLFAGIKSRYPNSQLTVLVDQSQKSLARHNPHIDEVLEIDLHSLRNRTIGVKGLAEKVLALKGELSWLASKHFEWIINLNTSRLAALISLLPHSTQRFGPSLNSDRRRLLPASRADLLMALITKRRLIRFNLADVWVNYAELPSRPPEGLVYSLSPADREKARIRLFSGRNGPLIGLQLGSRHPSRQWPVEHFTELARRLIDTQNATIILLGTKSESHLGQAFISRLPTHTELSKSMINLVGQTTLEELAGTLSWLDLLITTDTGTMHLAAALKTPILALFLGPAFVHETGPHGPDHLILQIMTSCSPCTEGQSTCDNYPCRYLITPDMALAAANWQLAYQRQKKASLDEFRNNRVLDSALRELSLWTCSAGPPPLNGQVRVFMSQVDEFGAVYRPLISYPLDTEEVLALAIREAGRVYWRPNYRMRVEQVRQEMQSYLDGPASAAATLIRALKAFIDQNGSPKIALDPQYSFLPNLLNTWQAQGRADTAQTLLKNIMTILELAEGQTEFPVLRVKAAETPQINIVR